MDDMERPCRRRGWPRCRTTRETPELSLGRHLWLPRAGQDVLARIYWTRCTGQDGYMYHPAQLDEIV